MPFHDLITYFVALNHCLDVPVYLSIQLLKGILFALRVWQLLI